jgi:hypothetical protein
MKGPLSRLEARMEALVEGTFARLLAGHVHPRDVAIQLARALEDSAAGGRPATRYAVQLHPSDAQALLRAHPRLPETLAAELLTLAREAQLTLPSRPEVRLVPDPDQPARQVVVSAEADGLGASTQTMTATPPSHPAANMPRAFLIVNGERTVVLAELVLTLGRRLDSDLVVDDPRVSRTHAQLRLRFGRYVVYDLGSSGGTFVNGQRVAECVLRPGDVISLNGVPIIYGESE